MRRGLEKQFLRWFSSDCDIDVQTRFRAQTWGFFPQSTVRLQKEALLQGVMVPPWIRDLWASDVYARTKSTEKELLEGARMGYDEISKAFGKLSEAEALRALNRLRDKQALSKGLHKFLCDVRTVVSQDAVYNKALVEEQISPLTTTTSTESSSSTIRSPSRAIPRVMPEFTVASSSSLTSSSSLLPSSTSSPTAGARSMHTARIPHILDISDVETRFVAFFVPSIKETIRVVWGELGQLPYYRHPLIAFVNHPFQAKRALQNIFRSVKSISRDKDFAYSFFVELHATEAFKGGAPRRVCHLLRFDRLEGEDDFQLADINGVVEGMEELTYGLNQFVE